MGKEEEEEDEEMKVWPERGVSMVAVLSPACLVGASPRFGLALKSARFERKSPGLASRSCLSEIPR